jgi:hypothetical protein
VQEVGLALAVLGLLAAAALLNAFVGFLTLFGAGAALVALGLALGVPLGVVYHLQLYRALVRRGELVRAWWLRPTSLHPPLGSPERRAVMPWFYAGALSVAVAFIGCAALLVALLSER